MAFWFAGHLYRIHLEIKNDLIEQIQTYRSMKNQYFGDVNDYRKYGLLRTLLSETELSHTLCWMLTPSEGRSDGKFVDYLASPERWQHLDPPLFEFLRTTVHEHGIRAVAEIERSSLLPRTTYHSPIVPDNRTGRDRYFADFRDIARASDFVFFDPDNGLEVKTVSKGRRASSKYLYWDELENTYRNGHSILAYQHFPREDHKRFTARMAAECTQRTDSPWVGAFSTTNVLFLLIPQPRHASALRGAARRVGTTWSGEITLDLVGQ